MQVVDLKTVPRKKNQRHFTRDLSCEIQSSKYTVLKSFLVCSKSMPIRDKDIWKEMRKRFFANTWQLLASRSAFLIIYIGCFRRIAKTSFAPLENSLSATKNE